WLKELQLRTGITTIYVTHDQSEALSMSDRIAVMKDGRVVQQGAPEEIYERPANAFVAGFIGRTSFIPATVLGSSRCGMLSVRIPATDVTLAVKDPGHGVLDSEVVLGIRPEKIRIHHINETNEHTEPNQNVFDTELIDVAYI